MLEEVVKSCHSNLLSKSAKLPLVYLISRGITFEEIKKHNIGYIGNVFNNINGGDEDSKLFNKWCGYKGKLITQRIVFPIYNELGQLKGIETRALDKKAFENLKIKKEHKELLERLPESALRYKKFYLKKFRFSAYFFGLPYSLVSIWKSKEVFLTEGIFDALSFLKIKPNCVSSMTANINEYQIMWLKRYVNKIIVLFDMDKKGREATEKIKKTLEGDIQVHSIGLKGKDVNEFMINHGQKELNSLVEEKLKFYF